MKSLTDAKIEDLHNLLRLLKEHSELNKPCSTLLCGEKINQSNIETMIRERITVFKTKYPTEVTVVLTSSYLEGTKERDKFIEKLREHLDDAIKKICGDTNSKVEVRKNTDLHLTFEFDDKCATLRQEDAFGKGQVYTKNSESIFEEVAKILRDYLQNYYCPNCEFKPDAIEIQIEGTTDGTKWVNNLQYYEDVQNIRYKKENSNHKIKEKIIKAPNINDQTANECLAVFRAYHHIKIFTKEFENLKRDGKEVYQNLLSKININVINYTEKGSQYRKIKLDITFKGLFNNKKDLDNLIKNLELAKVFKQ